MVPGYHDRLLLPSPWQKYASLIIGVTKKWSIPDHLVFACIVDIEPFVVTYLISKRQSVDDW